MTASRAACLLADLLKQFIREKASLDAQLPESPKKTNIKKFADNVQNQNTLLHRTLGFVAVRPGRLIAHTPPSVARPAGRTDV